MSRPGRTALWQNLLRDNQKPASALDAVISVILPNGTNGTHLSATHPSRSSRCPELASSYYLCHYRPTSACFCHRLYTSARRLPVACPSLACRLLCLLCPLQPASLPLPLLQPARCSSLPAVLPAVLPALPALPLCRSACSSPPACKKSETLKSLAFLLSGLGLRQPPPRLSARQSRKPSRTSCSRILAQSATGCFSPSTNRSGQPRLQSSM